MFRSQVILSRRGALVTSLSVVAVFYGSAMTAFAQEGYATSNTRIFNMADEMRDERPAMREGEQVQKNSNINARTDVKVKIGEPEATFEEEAALADGVEGNEPAAEDMTDKSSVQVEVEVETSPAIQKEEPKKTARERIYERIRKNRGGQ